MRLAFLLLLISAIFHSSVLVAQTDSAFTDTVVIIKAPHIIRHEVIIQSPSEPAKKIPSMKFGLYYGLGNNHIKSNEDSVKVTGKSFQNFGIQIGYNLKHLNIEIGVGILNNKVEYNRLNSFELERRYREWAETDRDTFVIKDPETGAITKSVITVLFDSVYQESHDLINFNSKSVYQRAFLKIPLSIGYTFDLPFNFKVTPSLEFVINQLISENTDQKAIKAYALKTRIPQYGFDLKLEYYLTKHIFFDLKYFWIKSMGKVDVNAHQDEWKFTGLNFAINYKIGN